MTAAAEALELDDAAFRSPIIRSGGEGYDLHRQIWNGAFDGHRAAIVRCAAVSDIAPGQR